MNATIEVSTINQNNKSAATNPANPTVNVLRFDIDAIVNTGKRAVVASIADPVTSRRFEADAIVTKFE